MGKLDMLKMNNVIVYDENGRSVPIKKLWENQDAVLVFLRHFSCLACWAHVNQVLARRYAFEDRGANIYFIGNGSHREIAKFKQEKLAMGAKIYTDPSRRSFEAAGLLRGVLRTLGPAAIVNAIGMVSRGFRQTRYAKFKGDLWQMGGVMVVSRQGEVKYHYVSQSTGDFPTTDDILQFQSAGQPYNIEPLGVLDYSVR